MPSTYQHSRFNLLLEQSVLSKSIAGIGRNDVDRAFLGLVFNGLVEHEERLARVLSQMIIHAQSQPIGQQLLRHGLCSKDSGRRLDDLAYFGCNPQHQKSLAVYIICKPHSLLILENCSGQLRPETMTTSRLLDWCT